MTIAERIYRETKARKIDLASMSNLSIKEVLDKCGVPIWEQDIVRRAVEKRLRKAYARGNTN